jgi:hypothetical protein
MHRDTDTECWSVLLFGFLEKITFLAEENAGAPSFRANRAQLLVAEFDVDADTTASLVVQRSIDLQKMVKNSPPEETFLFFLVVAAYSPVELIEDCLVERGGSIGNSGKNSS